MGIVKNTASWRWLMSWRRGWPLGAAVLFCLVSAAAALRAFQAPAQDPAKDKGADTFNATCSKCHTPERILAVRRSRPEWDEIFDKMTKLGAQVTDDNYDTLIEYVMRHYGKININRGDAKDIAFVLDLSDGDADTIVKYRTDHGDFTDFDALAKVPGIDVKKLEEKKAAITF
jgi:competence protein ComEA